jgi:hypothetical protein
MRQIQRQRRCLVVFGATVIAMGGCTRHSGIPTGAHPPNTFYKPAACRARRNRPRADARLGAR